MGVDSRTKFVYLSYDDITASIGNGVLDGYDMCITKDTHEFYIIKEDLTPFAIKSKVYVFNSIDEANTQLNENTDTYVGQIVAVVIDDKCKGYIVNRDSDGKYYVSKLTEGDIPESGVIYIKGTLDNKIIVSELGEGTYSINGQYQIVPDGTVYLTGGKELFVCSSGSVHHITGNSIEKYTVDDDGTVSIDTYLTNADLSQFINKEEAEQMISDLISNTVEDEVNQALGKSIAQQSGIENILNK